MAPERFEKFEVQLPPSIDQPHPTQDQRSSTVHRVARYLSYDKFSNSEKAFLAAITSKDEPKTFHKVMHDTHWVKAMVKEIQALEKNETWMLEHFPDGK